MSESLDMMDVLYNSNHGGYSVSKKAIESYVKKMLQINPDYIFSRECISDCFDEECLGTCNESRYNYVKRHDPLLVEVFNELGDDFNAASYSKVKIWKMPKKYEDYYVIEEYDGKEDIWINYDRYKVDKIKKIIYDIESNGLDNDRKISEIGKVLLEKNELI
jgi:hypothetical protein